ncbi:MAG TPA: sugar transferase [Bacteroidales bacterium]|nr:sugar transferase [Bacteroidales bacterium]
MIISFLLLFTNRGNIFFIQSRPGLNGKVFKLIKFKTMNERKDSNGILLPDDIRITNIGKFLRMTSLDEIPQLLNIITGKMSWIGPRPLLVEYLPLYNNFQKRRHVVKPGITGWAQVNGRNAITWQEKFKHDIWYVDNLSFKLDMKIVFLTMKKVIMKEGISSDTSATMERFEGN